MWDGRFISVTWIGSYWMHSRVTVAKEAYSYRSEKWWLSFAWKMFNEWLSFLCLSPIQRRLWHCLILLFEWFHIFDHVPSVFSLKLRTCIEQRKKWKERCGDIRLLRYTWELNSFIEYSSSGFHEHDTSTVRENFSKQVIRISAACSLLHTSTIAETDCLLQSRGMLLVFHWSLATQQSNESLLQSLPVNRTLQSFHHWFNNIFAILPWQESTT